MDRLSACYFVPGVQVRGRHFCGKNTRLPEKEKKGDVINKYKILVP